MQHVSAARCGRKPFVPDIETALFGTTLGMTLRPRNAGGHGLHMRQITPLGAGSLQRVDKELSSRIMHAWVRHQVPLC